jgi:DNA repair protein RadC
MTITDDSTRPLMRLAAHGPKALTAAELLAVLLRTGEPGKPAVQLAQELIDQAGGLFQLLLSRPEQWTADTPRRRSRPEVAVVLELAKRATAEQLGAREVFNSPDLVKTFLQLHLAHRQHEVFAVIFLDAQNRMICIEEMFRGTLTQTSVYPREVVQRALELSAAAVVLAHNHPSGTVQPSRADEALTQTLKAALALVDVRVLDHVIVAAGDALSMAERGLI